MPQMSPKVTVSMFLLIICISLRANTENPGSKHHSCFTHFHVHFLLWTDKHGSQKLHWAALLTTEFLCILGTICGQEIPKPTRNSLLDFTWKLTAGFHLRAGHLFPRESLSDTVGLCYQGFALHLFLLIESPWRAICRAGQENNLFWAGRGSCLAGPTGPGQGGETSTGIFCCRLSVSHDSSWTCVQPEFFISYFGATFISW